ncbi:beta-ig-h3 fasciclin [Colletotrichum truncatum]|uniref:Beta-ig-h3 fasciclin n=1 Tax=Colletotrichum truncatum TaxID=5467 RepID=A0ACC3YZX5_COLTU|nr:beta-ig-h3 fasciclin [Colletotrichum truncatum]KAF6800848.1 beta-ig-h3 fasciclin [Colletotrichum truncatum]
MQLKGFFPLAFAALAAAAEPLNAVLKANNDTLSTLNSLLAMAPEIVKTLASSNDFTILAPSNDAFVKAMQMDPTFAQKATNVTFVKDLLMYHVVAGKTTASMFSTKPKFAISRLELPTRNGTGAQRVELVKKADQAVIFSGYKQMSTVSKPDIAFSGGVLHVIDSVLTLPGTPSDTALNTGLTSMAGALMKAGLVEGLDSLNASTVFAPTNAAFQAIGATAASMSPQDLAKILQYHVIMRQVRFSSGVTMKLGFKSLMGQKVTLRKQDSTVFVNSAKVIISDMITSEGVMHVIDSVLNPGEPKLTPNLSASSATPAFAGAVAAANAPFTDGVTPTANFVPASSSTTKNFKTTVGPAVLGLLGYLAVVVL